MSTHSPLDMNKEYVVVWLGSANGLDVLGLLKSFEGLHEYVIEVSGFGSIPIC